MVKNYICTSEGFVKGVERITPDSYETEVVYTDKVRDAKAFNTKAGTKFMVNHSIKGFIWKPFEENAIRNMYTVKKLRMAWKEEKDEVIQEWQPVKLMMSSDSDIAFLRSGKVESEEAMTFEEAKAEALRLNTEMLGELSNKIINLKELQEDDKQG